MTDICTITNSCRVRFPCGRILAFITSYYGNICIDSGYCEDPGPAGNARITSIRFRDHGSALEEYLS